MQIRAQWTCQAEKKMQGKWHKYLGIDWHANLQKGGADKILELERQEEILCTHKKNYRETYLAEIESSLFLQILEATVVSERSALASAPTKRTNEAAAGSSGSATGGNDSGSDRTNNQNRCTIRRVKSNF